VFHINPAAGARPVEAGAAEASALKEVGAAEEGVVMMLPEPQHAETVVLGAEGAAEDLRPSGVVIDMSTIHPRSSARSASSTMRIFSLAEECWRVARRVSRTVRSIVALAVATSAATDGVEEVRII
jgi:hypothetical protein